MQNSASNPRIHWKEIRDLQNKVQYFFFLFCKKLTFLSQLLGSGQKWLGPGFVERNHDGLDQLYQFATFLRLSCSQFSYSWPNRNGDRADNFAWKVHENDGDSCSVFDFKDRDHDHCEANDRRQFPYAKRDKIIRWIEKVMSWVQINDWFYLS